MTWEWAGLILLGYVLGGVVCLTVQAALRRLTRKTARSA